VSFETTDAMAEQFASLMTSAGFDETTSTGCLDDPPAYGRYEWVYGEGDREGDIGCYERTDSGTTTSQFLWTSDATKVMTWWSAPSLQAGRDYFASWTARS
jgi:hypothetical protein